MGLKKDVKKCVACGKGTVKPERPDCKHCGGTEWEWLGKIGEEKKRQSEVRASQMVAANEEMAMMEEARMLSQLVMKVDEGVAPLAVNGLWTQHELDLKQAKCDGFALGVAHSIPTLTYSDALPGTDVVDTIKEYKAKQVDTITFRFNETSEMLEIQRKDNGKLDDISKSLEEGMPSYTLHRFVHNDNNKATTTSDLLLYYCPENVSPKLLVLYSSCKAVLLNALLQQELPLPETVVCGQVGDISIEYIMDTLYPKKPVKKTWEKPGKPGRGKARMHRGTKKFQVA